jgi:dGTPase
MTIRERSEHIEKELLRPEASLSVDAVRDYPEEPCPIRTAYQRDRDRILHSTAFRRMKHKTQVYISPEGDHYRTRMTHTLEVAQIARTIARALSLNEDLTEAIALGHDLGHTPFGHVGESALNDACGHFRHNEQGVRIVERLEKKGKGLNLTRQVRDGILNHNGKGRASTWEGRVVKYADRIAYLTHDFDDAEISGMLTPEDLPEEVRTRFGERHSRMITSMVTDLIEHSIKTGTLSMTETGEKTLMLFREFMFKNVYIAPVMMPDRERGYHVVRQLYEHFMNHPDRIPELNRKLADTTSQAVTDFISSLTDNHAINLYKDIYVPRYWKY